VRISIPPSWRTRIYRYRLTATKCKKCGRAAYPPSNICRYCGSKEVEFIDLIDEKARLITWTIIYSAMEGFEEKRPVVLGILETINTKARVMAPLTDTTPEELRVGLMMEPVLRRIINEGDHGLIHYGVFYRPLLKSTS
jgi:uncharacterized OB-fold protein